MVGLSGIPGTGRRVLVGLSGTLRMGGQALVGLSAIPGTGRRVLVGLSGTLKMGGQALVGLSGTPETDGRRLDGLTGTSGRGRGRSATAGQKLADHGRMADPAGSTAAGRGPPPHASGVA
jgi:hypothetical protein